MSAPGLIPNVVQSSGPLILGYLMNWGLFGVVSIQVYFYYIAFPNDRTFCKCIVYGVYILETLQTIIVTHDAFASFGAGFGSFEALDNIQLTCLSIPILSGIVGCVVQMFYAYRINILSKSRVLGFVIAAISFIGCVAGIVTGVKSFQLGSLSKLSETTVFISAGFWWGCCALCDVMIALSMTYLLSRHDTGFKTTHLLISRLTRLTIETGTCTALVAIINLILFFRFPKTNYYTVPVLVIAKLYCNTLLVLFNSRMRIVGGREEDPGQAATLEFSTRGWQMPTFNNRASAYMEDQRTTPIKDDPPWAAGWNLSRHGEAPTPAITFTRDIVIMDDTETRTINTQTSHSTPPTNTGQTTGSLLTAYPFTTANSTSTHN